jgi:predicted dithiol-disulfide oxidoreductase (DUF899 family)
VNTDIHISVLDVPIMEDFIHNTKRMLQALDCYWTCCEGMPKGRYPRGKYTAEDWWNRYERYREKVERVSA